MRVAVFKVMDEQELAFLYQDKTKRGRVSRFSKIVSRDRQSDDSHGRRAR